MYDAKTEFMFDTNIFDAILERKHKLLSKYDYYVTHIQRDEINAMKQIEKKEQLLNLFNDIKPKQVPTKSFILGGISKFGSAQLGDGKLLDKLRNGNIKNTGDALIAETAIKNNFILVTEDNRLLKKVKNIGGRAITLEQFLKEEFS